MTAIHPTAIVDPTAKIAPDAEIGPYTIVEPGAIVGAGCRIGAHVTLGERVVLGKNVRVHNYACLGTASQDLKHQGEISHAEIGDECLIREFVTVNRGTREGSATRVGPCCVLLAYSHVAHECRLDEGVLLVNGSQLGGEVVVERQAIVGGLAGVHQFCRIGELALVGACSKVTLDIPPFMIADGRPAHPVGPNVVGLQRAGLPASAIGEIRAIFHAIFARNSLFTANIAGLGARFPDSSYARSIERFCSATMRGVSQPRSRAANQRDPDVSIYPGARPAE